MLIFNDLEIDGFKQQQLQYERVREAYDEKGAVVVSLLGQKKLKPETLRLFIRAFKQEKKLEIWAKNQAESQYILLITYDFCTTSGTLGPKREQGDLQTPEGFYSLDRFNPTSNFHLSLGVNYPNESDRILGTKGKLGGDIFIHGNCVTVGCIPITDDKIKELYLLCVEARNAGQTNISVHIFPFQMNEGNLTKNTDNQFFNFWKNLQKGYDLFEKTHQIPTIKVSKNGLYQY